MQTAKKRAGASFLQRLLCWRGHDFYMSSHIEESSSFPNGDTNYKYNQKCSRDGCGQTQRIVICSIVGKGRFSFLEKEWID